MSTSNRAVFSVDFELFTQTPAYRSATGETDEQDIGLAAGAYLREVLDTHDARATFFVVSTVAERYPDTVRSISNDGHEIGSHTHSHTLLSTLDESNRQEEMRYSRSVLEDVTGQTVDGFRAPAFDITADHFDALDTAGYTYDASIAPSRRIPGWYGGDYDTHRPCPVTEIQSDAPSTLAELPVSVMPGVRLPLTGTWLRFFGPRYTILGMKLLARRGITPVLYVHPWELVDLPDIEGVPTRVYWRTGEWMRRAVERILAQPFDFVAAQTAVENTIPSGNDSNDTTHPRDNHPRNR
jgi:peptidoglycan/xylan/chitin deacetylase (PgdA/CDA1 family)